MAPAVPAPLAQAWEPCHQAQPQAGLEEAALSFEELLPCQENDKAKSLFPAPFPLLPSTELQLQDFQTSTAAGAGTQTRSPTDDGRPQSVRQEAPG